MLNTESATCDARTLAALFNTTTRNIAHYVERGMPVYRRGKAGRAATFKVPWAMYWYAGWNACREWHEPIPGPLETVLVGYAIDKGYPGFTFSDWLQRSKMLAIDMGYTEATFDKAVQYITANNLIRSSRRR